MFSRIRDWYYLIIMLVLMCFESVTIFQSAVAPFYVTPNPKYLCFHFLNTPLICSVCFNNVSVFGNGIPFAAGFPIIMMISQTPYPWHQSREKSRGESTSLSMRWLLIWISCLKMLKNTTPMSPRYFRYRTSCWHRYLSFLSMARFQDYSPTCFYRDWMCWSNARPFLQVWCIIKYCHTNMIIKQH